MQKIKVRSLLFNELLKILDTDILGIILSPSAVYHSRLFNVRSLWPALARHITKRTYEHYDTPTLLTTFCFIFTFFMPFGSNNKSLAQMSMASC